MIEEPEWDLEVLPLLCILGGATRYMVTGMCGVPRQGSCSGTCGGESREKAWQLAGTGLHLGFSVGLCARTVMCYLWRTWTGIWFASRGRTQSQAPLCRMLVAQAPWLNPTQLRANPRCCLCSRRGLARLPPSLPSSEGHSTCPLVASVSSCTNCLIMNSLCRSFFQTWLHLAVPSDTGCHLLVDGYLKQASYQANGGH